MRPSITHHSPQIQAVENHTRILSGNVSLGTNNNDQSKNILGWHALDITTPVAPNTDFAVPVNLGYIPSFYRVTKINSPANIYTGLTPWTKQNIYLRCSAASVIVSLFIE